MRRALFSSAGPNLVDCGLFLCDLQSNAVHSGFAKLPGGKAGLLRLASVLQPLAKRRRRARQTHNDVSFFVRSARELRRVGSVCAQISFCMALARRIRLSLWRTNERADLLAAPHLFLSDQQLVETQPQRAACRAVEAPQLGAA